MGIKDFMFRKMLEAKMKGVSKEDQEKAKAIISKKPELFQKITAEIQEEVGKGKSEMSAALEVMAKYKDEIQEIMGQDK